MIRVISLLNNLNTLKPAYENMFSFVCPETVLFIADNDHTEAGLGKDYGKNRRLRI